MNSDGFKKISTIEHGGLHSKDDMEFQNPYFVRDDAGLMAHIKRKVMVMAWDIKFKVNHLVNDVCSVLRFKRSKFWKEYTLCYCFFLPMLSFNDQVPSNQVSPTCTSTYVFIGLVVLIVSAA